MGAQEEAQRRELERRLADLKARMPAHSIPPSMMIELDELEEQLDALKERRPERRDSDE
jgi:hypothetical protein